MKEFVELPEKRRNFYFQQASDVLGLSNAAIEKDFWVVWVLSRLFTSDILAPNILFKGGTSLSKVFGLIDRFSEDIDLILNWDEVVTEDPMAERSNSKQDRFNKAIPQASRDYIVQIFLPEVQGLLEGVCSADIEASAPDVINIAYPSSFTSQYLRPEIRLEIGPLAQWIPNAQYRVTSFVAKAFPKLFKVSSCAVQAIKAERTFWEKATILHHEAHRPETSSVPVRYSRHYYDLYLMSREASVKTAALGDLEMLASVVAFKQKFYPRGWAKYDFAKPGSLRLIPPAWILDALRRDYVAMGEMIFGRHPSFDEIVQGLTQLEEEINELK
jgi:hypothetical protein